MRIITIILLTCLCSGVCAQRASVTVVNMNILHKGYPNPITVLVEGCGCDEILLEGNNIEIEIDTNRSDEYCHYTLYPIDFGKGVIRIFSNKSGKKKISINQRISIKTWSEN